MSPDARFAPQHRTRGVAFGGQLAAAHSWPRRGLAEWLGLGAVPMIWITGLHQIRPTDPSGGLTFASPVPRRRGWIDAMLMAVQGSAAETNPVASAAAPAADVPDLAGVRVLLAEDNQTNQKVAAKMLKRLGCEFEVVEDGLVALGRLAEVEFDLVLMDVQMPRMDGYQATHEIRRREQAHPGSRHLPVIAMTAHARQDDRERCIAAQMDDYLSKPVTLAELAAVLARWRPRAGVDRMTPPPPTLRISRLQELSQGDTDFEQEILDCLLTDIATGIDRLRAALEPLAPGRIATTLHGVVGACRTVGADDLGQFCRDQEHQATEPGFRPDAAWLAAFERKRDELVAAIAAHRAG